MAFKILARHRIKAREALENSYVPDAIPLITHIMGKPKGEGHNLVWKKPLGEVDFIVELRESKIDRFGVSLKCSIPELGYHKDASLVKSGANAKRFVETLMTFHYDIQKLPKYKKLDDATREKLLQFQKQILQY